MSLTSFHRHQEPLRDFIYVSDSKLEQFFDQIGQSILAQISSELKIDLKVVSYSAQKAANPATTRMAKLQIVERFIEKNHDIGTIEHPGSQFFRGGASFRQVRFFAYVWLNALIPGASGRFRSYLASP